MKQRKQRISDFIQSIEGNEISNAGLIIGGTSEPGIVVMTTTNGRDCLNDRREACHKSRNDGDCRNVSGCCNNSSNGGACNNAYDKSLQPSPNTVTTCGMQP